MLSAQGHSEEALDLLKLGVGIFDRDLRLAYCNPAFRRLRRYPDALCRTGVTLSTLLRHNAERGDFGPGDPAAQVAERLAEIGASGTRDLEREMADGQIVHIGYRRTQTGGLVVTFEDHTAERTAERALRASDERHALVTRATSDGIYDWNVVDDELFVSDNLTKLLALDLTNRSSRIWAEQVHPDDYDGYVAALRSHFRGDAEAIEVDYRLRARGGGYRWVHDRGVGVRGADGRVVRLVGAVRDITEMREARAEIEHVQSRLMGSLGTIADGILMVDAGNRVELFNERYVEIFSQAAGGADLGEVVVRGRDFFEMIRHGYGLGMFKPHPGGVDAWIKARRQAWARPVAKWELELANGAWILLNERLMPDGGRISVYTDITEFKRREAEARAARQRFEEAIEAISSGFALWDAEDRLVLSNTRYRRYFAEIADLVTPGAAFGDIIRLGVERGHFPLAGGDVETYLAGIAGKRLQANGAPREQLVGGLWLQVTDHRTKDGGIVSIYTDVTELKTKQMEIEKQSAILELTLENMGQGITLVDKELRTIALNRKFLELMELPEDRFQRGFTMEEAFRFNAERGEYGPGDVEEQVATRVALSAKFQAHRIERIRPDGTVIEIVGNPIDGGGFVATYTDITERKRAEEKLRDALAEFDAILGNIDYGVLFMDSGLRTRIVNRAFGRIWNIPQDYIDQHPTMQELIEYHRDSGFYDVAPQDWDRWLADRVRQIKAGDIPPGEFVRGDGKVLSDQCVVLPDGGRMLTYFDITELKSAEQMARDSEARLRGILENSPIGVAVIDDDDTILFHNPRFPEILRGPGQALVGTSSKRFRIDAEEVAAWKARFRAEGKVAEREVKYRGLDGGEVWSLVTNERMGWEGTPARLTWIYDITEAKANREALVIARDEAEAALADLRRAQERLVQSEKMASLGQLTAGIAHEIKNPLNFVNNFASLSAELLDELSEVLAGPIAALGPDDRDDAEDLLRTVQQNLGKIDEHGRRADSIVKNMLLHSREGPSERQRAALNPIAEEALNLAYHGARAVDKAFNVEIVRSIDPEAGAIDCYPQELMRVFLNLITNGMYAANKRKSEDGGGFAPTISLTTRRRDGAVQVEVRDNGTGIPPEVKDKIFLPFFTTKPAGQGTGLGLSLSHDIVVKQHGGTLSVESEPGRHTAFLVTLPIS